MKFKAVEIFADYDENDVLIIGFMDDLKQHYFMIQYNHNEQDYYIEKSDQSMSGYNGIAKLVLSDTKIKIEFDQIGIDYVKERTIEIEISCSVNEFENLKDKLGIVLKNRCFIQ